MCLKELKITHNYFVEWITGHLSVIVMESRQGLVSNEGFELVKLLPISISKYLICCFNISEQQERK